MAVTQTATDLKAETTTKRTPPPADAPQADFQAAVEAKLNGAKLEITRTMVPPIGDRTTSE